MLEYYGCTEYSFLVYIVGRSVNVAAYKLDFVNIEITVLTPPPSPTRAYPCRI